MKDPRSRPVESSAPDRAAPTGAPPPCPTGKVCRPQGGFIHNPAAMTSEKVLTCFSPAE